MKKSNGLKCDNCDEPVPELERRIRESPIFQELREWRRKEAENKPAYTIAHDSSLLSIVIFHPDSLEELRSCSGFKSGSRADIYGDAILKILSKYDKGVFGNSSCRLCAESSDELLDDTSMEPLRDPDNPSMGGQWRVSRCRCCGQKLPGGGKIVGEGEPLDWFHEIYEANKRDWADMFRTEMQKRKWDGDPGNSDVLDKLRKLAIALKETSVKISRKELNNRKDGEPVVEITMRSNSMSDLVKRFKEFVDEPSIGRITDAKDPQFPFLWRPVWNQPDGDKEGYWEITFRHAYRD